MSIGSNSHNCNTFKRLYKFFLGTSVITSFASIVFEESPFGSFTILFVSNLKPIGLALTSS